MLRIDGQPLTPRLDSVAFPSMSELQDGLGSIRLRFHAVLPAAGRDRKITLDNHHQNQISVYLVNSLVPQDSGIHTTAQNRNASQSNYELDYTQAGVMDLSTDSRQWLIAIAALLSAIWGARFASRSGTRRDRIS